MNDRASLAYPRKPLHLWVIGVLGLLWNAPAAVDFVMTNIRDPAYMALFPAESVQMIDEFPVWMTAAWAIGVFGAVAGSLALLLRSRHAVGAFALSLAGLATGTVYQAGVHTPEALKTLGMTPMTFALWTAAGAFLIYGVRMRRRGVLR